ncbi:MAG: hypothetical protein WB384_14610 [Candidatus Sulfotelmatobacter sp.]
MTRKAKTRAICLFVLGATFAVTLIFLAKRPKPIFGREGIKPTLRHWYYAKHFRDDNYLREFRCGDDDLVDDFNRFGCASCPVGDPNRVVEIGASIKTGPLGPSPKAACHLINTLFLEGHWNGCDPDEGAPTPCRVKNYTPLWMWTIGSWISRTFSPPKENFGFGQMVICWRKPWDGFIKVDGQKFSCAELENNPAP